MTEAGLLLFRHGGSVPASGYKPDASSKRLFLSDHAGVDNRWSTRVGLLRTIKFEPVATIERHRP